MRHVVVAIALVLATAASATTADAHPLDLGYLTIERTPGGLDVHLELDLGAAATILAVAPDTLDAAAVAGRAELLADRTYARAPITGCTFHAATAARTGRTVRISSAATCEPIAHRWVFPFVRDHIVSPRFQLMVKDTVAGSERLTLIEATSPALELGTTPIAAVGLHDFVRSGIEHIGVAPSQWRTPSGGLRLPDGIDHIMFLLALMLAGGTLLEMVGVASGFTVGHSITLALAALDVVRPPASIIEPLIALSIALAAIEAYSGRVTRRRWQIAAGFGLIHGFGFATALTHLELTTRGKLTALLGYNVGVELGQIVVVLAVAPLVMLAHRHPRQGRPLLRIAAAGIFVAGLCWFVQRLG